MQIISALFQRLHLSGALRWAIAAILISTFIGISCKKSSPDIPPITNWEDNGYDSATLRIIIQNAQGIKIYGQYVNLALSKDSLNNRILVRQTPTNSAGVAIFRKLYPRVLYYNCYAVTQATTYFGSGNVRLSAGMVKDTILTVY